MSASAIWRSSRPSIGKGKGVSEGPSGGVTENREVERFGPSVTADPLRWPFRHGSVAMSDFR